MDEPIGHESESTVLNHPAVTRVREALQAAGHSNSIRALAESARTAADAAGGLGIDVGQIASSIVFSCNHAGTVTPVLVVTSGRHRVDTARVASVLGVEALARVDAAYVREVSGFAIGGVSPIGWSPSSHSLLPAALVFVDAALNDYDTVWAAAGHPHTVFATTHDELVRLTGGHSIVVGD